MSELDNNLRTEVPEATSEKRPSMIHLLSVSAEEAEQVVQSQGDPVAEAPAVMEHETSNDVSTEVLEVRNENADSQQAEAQSEAQPSVAAAVEARNANLRRARPTDTVNATRPEAGKSKLFALQAAGALFALLGMSLVAAPKLSSQAAEWLGQHSDVRTQSGTLIVVGLCLMMAGFLRNTLRDMRGSLEVVKSETARLGEMAKDGQSVRATLNTVRGENSTLSQDVVRLEAELTRLVEIVENPDYTMSIFRLAASVDQLGKHVEVSMKGQFEQLEPRIAAVAQHVDQAERQLTSTIAQMSSLMKEQYRSSQLALKEGLDELHSAAEIADTRSEQNQETMARIEALIQSRHEAVSEGLASLGERVAKSEGQIVSGVSELRGRIERQIEKQSAAWLAEFKQLAGQLEQAERNQTSGVKQIGQQVDLQLGAQAKDLRQGLKLLADQAGQQHEELDGKLALVAARIDQQARDHEAAIEIVREQTMEATRSAKGELAAGLEQIGMRVEERALEQQVAIEQARDQAMAATHSSKSELAANLAQLGMRLDEQACEQQVALQQTRDQALEATHSSKDELVASLEQLGTRVDQQARELRLTIQQAREQASEATHASRREFDASLEQFAMRVDQQACEQQAAIQQTLEATRAVRSELAANLEQLAAQLDKSERDQLANSLDVAQRAEQANVATKRELATKLELLESQLEQLGREQLAAVRKASQEATQIVTTATREFEAGMQQLCVQQEQQAVEHQASVQQASVDAQQTTTASRRELATIFEQVGARIEKAVAVRSDELAGDLLDVSAILIFITTEVRTAIAEALGGSAAPKSEPEVALAATVEMPPAEIDGAPTADVQPEDVWAEDMWMSLSDGPEKPAQAAPSDGFDDSNYPPDEDRS